MNVTDDARADAAWIEWAQNLTGAYVTTPEEAREQIEGLVSGLLELTGLDRAAGRAETTTATDVRAEVIATLASAATRSGLTHYEDRGRVVVPLLTPEDVYRALADAGLFARPLPETTTEWGVRSTDTGHPYQSFDETEARARAERLDWTLVRREVTAWTEADR